VLTRIDQLVTEVPVKPGTVLTRQGGLSSEAFIIAEGTAEVRVDDEVVGESSVGELIGELGILEHKPRSATVTATSPMTILIMNPRELNSLVQEESLGERLRANIERHRSGPQPHA